MVDDTEKFNDDPRPSCKYGVKCYQRNPNHIKKFKHPSKGDSEETSPPKKMARLSNDSQTPESTRGRNTMSPRTQENTPVTSPAPLGNITPKTATHISKQATDSFAKNAKSIIKEKFLVEMPDDFYSFWEFCKSIKKSGNMKDVFKTVNLFLVGPFDVLLETLPELDNKSDYLIHWRYYYDPPEFQTVLMSPGAPGFHLGYFRDSPEELPCFVASNESEKGCKITPVADNLFGAVLVYLENAKKKSPFVSVACQQMITQLKDWTIRHSFYLETVSSRMKKRKVAVVANSFHGAGIVVPVDKKQVGYRPLIETDAKLKILIQNVIDSKTDKEREVALAILQPVITYANIATDECDFGTSLELGINFFCTGDKSFHNTIIQLLSNAYNLLNRDVFDRIINTHIGNRRKGSNLSCADI